MKYKIFMILLPEFMKKKKYIYIYIRCPNTRCEHSENYQDRAAIESTRGCSLTMLPGGMLRIMGQV